MKSFEYAAPRSLIVLPTSRRQMTSVRRQDAGGTLLKGGVLA